MMRGESHVESAMTSEPYTAIPNWLIEAMPQMPASTFQVACVIARQTFGYKDEGSSTGRREWDRISVSQFQKATGLSRQGTQDALVFGLGKWFIRREIGQYFEYQLCNSVARLDYATELTMQLSGTEPCNSVEQLDAKPCNSVDPQKKELQKEKKGETREPPAPKQRQPLPPHLQNFLDHQNGNNVHYRPRNGIIADAYTEQARQLGIDPPSFSRRIDALSACVGKRSYIDAAVEDNGTLNSIKAGVLTLARLGHHTEADYGQLCESFAAVNDWMDSPVPTLNQLLDHAGKLKDGVLATKPRVKMPKPNANGFYDFPSMAAMKEAAAVHPEIRSRVTVKGTKV